MTESTKEDARRIPFVVFPNSGGAYENGKGFIGLDGCDPLENFVEEWISFGANIVGGCCRVYADDISRIRRVVDTINLE